MAFWLLLVAVACANSGDPPGGPEDRTPPTIARVEPESGAVLTVPPAEANVYFDEVINERTSGSPTDISSALLLSPTTGAEKVAWHRDRISIRPKNGFVAGRIYHLEVFPVITDLRNNKMRGGRTIVFSTGPEIPHAALQGTVVDWVGGKPAPRALIEAVLMPDSLVYRTLADSGGVFRMSQLPPGHYRVYGVMDSNNDRRRGAREVFDSAGVDVDSIVPPLELYAFVRDTTGPRLRTGEEIDSMTLKITFDRPLDPTLTIDTSMVSVAPLDDSTNTIGLVGVFTQKALDSLRTHLADSTRVAKALADSLRQAAVRDSTARARNSKIPPDSARARIDSLRRASQPADSTRRARPDTTRRTPVAAAEDSSRRRPPLDSTRADRMLARRPAPTDVRIIRLAVPLVPDTRYVIYVRGARSLSGNVNEAPARTQIRAVKPEAPRDRGTAGRDSTRRDSGSVRDSTIRPDTTTRRDSTTRRDTTVVVPPRP